jgi:hypothetical protein
MSECGDLGSCFGGCNDAPAAVPSTQPIALEPGIGPFGNGGGGGHFSSSSKQPNFKQSPMCYPNSSESAAKVSGTNAQFKSSQTGLNQSSNEKPPPLPPRLYISDRNSRVPEAPVVGSDTSGYGAMNSSINGSQGGLSSYGQSFLSPPPSVHPTQSGFDSLRIDDGGYSGVSWSHKSSYRSQ